MSNISTWSTTAASNNSAAPDGFPEGMAPSGVNNAAREVMAAVRTQHEDAQWIDLGNTPTNTAATIFTLVGDQTTDYHVGRRVKCTDATTLYGTITVSAFTSLTTVTVVLDSGVLSGSLTAVALGIIGANNSSLGNIIVDTVVADTVTSLGALVGVTAAISGAATVGGTLSVDDAIDDVGGLIRTANRNSHHGCTLSNGTDTDNDLDITAGTWMDSTGIYNLTLPSTFVKELDAVYVAGSAAGGLFDGTATPAVQDTTYHVFLIRKDSDGSIDVGFDVSVTAANKPAGHTYFRRIGSINTLAGAATFTQFTQRGDEFLLMATLQSISNGAPGTDANLFAMDVPSDIQVNALISVHMVYGSSNAHCLVTALDQTDTVPSNTLFNMKVTNNSQTSNSQFSTRTDTSGQIRYRQSHASADIDIYTNGWIDERAA
jgi:hypothetical protein